MMTSAELATERRALRLRRLPPTGGDRRHAADGGVVVPRQSEAALVGAGGKEEPFVRVVLARALVQ